jgi:hypothetical protein
MKPIRCLFVLLFFSGMSLYAQDAIEVTDGFEITVDGESLTLDPGTAAAVAGATGGIMIIYLVVVLLVIICLWKVYAKAGKPGWAAIVPIYNVIVLLEIVGRPLWWIVLFFIPFANIVAAILLYIGLAKAFGKGGGYGIGLLLLPVIFLPMLAFGSAQYVGGAQPSPAGDPLPDTAG